MVRDTGKDLVGAVVDFCLPCNLAADVSTVSTYGLDSSVATEFSLIDKDINNVAPVSMVVLGAESDISNSLKTAPSIFDKLPIELRLAIWALCVEPRLVSNLAKVRGNKIPTVFTFAVNLVLICLHLTLDSSSTRLHYGASLSRPSLTMSCLITTSTTSWIYLMVVQPPTPL
jgi:hypothetical protein